MSILGASKVGAKLGAFASDLIFDYTKSKYEDKVSKLEGLIAQLKTHQTTLEDLKSRIPSFWEDELANKTVATLNLTLQDVARKMETAKDLVVIFKETINELDGSKENLSSKLDDAIGLLEILD